MQKGIPAEAPLGAEIAVAGGAHPHDGIPARLDGDRAAATAVVARRGCLFEVPRPHFEFGQLRRASADRADLDALSAELAVMRTVEGGADTGFSSPQAEGERPHPAPLLADPHAFAAEDAAARVPLNEGGSVIGGRIPLFLRKEPVPQPVLVHEVLQAALARLVAYRAFEGAIDEEEFED